MPESTPPLKPLRLAELAIAAVSGAVLALAFPGVEWGFLAYVAFVPLCLLVFRPRRKRATVALFGAFATGLYLTLLYWFLAMHPLTWLGFTVGQSLAVVVTAWLVSSTALVCQVMALGLCFGYVAQRWPRAGAGHVVLLALGWGTLEWLTSLGPFGFTWSNLALTQYRYLPLVQVLALWGPYPLASLIVGFNGAIALGIRRQFGQPFSPRAWQPVGLAALPLVAVALYGAVRLAQPLPPTTFSVEVVQGNIAGGEKWARGQGALDRMADKYLRLTELHTDTNMVLWPETAMPTYMNYDFKLARRLQQSAIAHHRYLVTGTLEIGGNPQDHPRLYNAVTAFGPVGEVMGFDAKRHLVPFGEYLPGRSWLPAALLKNMGLVNVLGEDYTPGGTPHLFEMPFAKIGVGVCYDGIFPDAMRPVTLAGADVLALVTNDAWYKDTTAPRVLSAHAALRAIESRRYVLRAANTGISSVIEPTGNFQVASGVFQDVAIVGRAAPMHELTPYSRFGDWASVLGAFGFLGMLGRRWKNRKTSFPG